MRHFKSCSLPAVEKLMRRAGKRNHVACFLLLSVIAGRRSAVVNVNYSLITRSVLLDD